MGCSMGHNECVRRLIASIVEDPINISSDTVYSQSETCHSMRCLPFPQIEGRATSSWILWGCLQSNKLKLETVYVWAANARLRSLPLIFNESTVSQEQCYFRQHWQNGFVDAPFFMTIDNMTVTRLKKTRLDENVSEWSAGHLQYMLTTMLIQSEVTSPLNKS